MKPLIGGMSEAALDQTIKSVVRRPGTLPPPVTFIAKVTHNAPSDEDFPHTPPNGTVVVDIGNSMIWARVGDDDWRGTDLS